MFCASCFTTLGDQHRRACSAGRALGRFATCGGCKAAGARDAPVYCGLECQKAHWSSHRQVCGAGKAVNLKPRMAGFASQAEADDAVKRVEAAVAKGASVELAIVDVLAAELMRANIADPADMYRFLSGGLRGPT